MPDVGYTSSWISECHSACPTEYTKGDSDDFFHFHFGLLHSFIIDYNSCVLTIDSPEMSPPIV